VQLFWRLNHARQTVDFVRRQTNSYARLDKAVMTIPEVDFINNLVLAHNAGIPETDDDLMQSPAQWPAHVRQQSRTLRPPSHLQCPYLAPDGRAARCRRGVCPYVSGHHRLLHSRLCLTCNFIYCLGARGAGLAARVRDAAAGR